jgi:hypothetical protein
MQRLKVSGLALVAVLALSGIAAASASAVVEPAFVSGGVKNTFTSTSGKGTLETVGGKTVKCTADTNAGEITKAAETNKITKLVITFTGCESSGIKCNSAGKGSGVIETNALVGQLGFLKQTAPEEIGVDLEPKEGKFFVEFECTGFAKSKVEGQVICKVSGPYDVKVKTFELICEQSKGAQKFTTITLETMPGSGLYEKDEKDELLSSLNGGANEKAGDGSEKDVVTPAEEVLIS